MFRKELTDKDVPQSEPVPHKGRGGYKEIGKQETHKPVKGLQILLPIFLPIFLLVAPTKQKDSPAGLPRKVTGTMTNTYKST
jgi:hypothetical protein